MNLSTIILAAGQGTRMRSSLPKVLHQVASKPLIGHIMTMTKELGLKDKVVVIGPGMEQLGKYIELEDPTASCIVQKKRLGTGDAVKIGMQALRGKHDVLVLYGDTPFIKASTIRKMYEVLQSDDKSALVILGFKAHETSEYGRLIVNNKNELEQIVEFLDCTPQQKSITSFNSGVMMIRGKHVSNLLAKIKPNNAKQEFYLTDLVLLSRESKLLCRHVTIDETEALAINTKPELAKAEAVIQNQLRQKFMEQGVTLIDPNTVYFASDTQIEADVTVYPNVFFGSNVVVKSGVVIKSFSHLEGVTVENDAIIGPFARIRPGTIVGTSARIGNFVEIKNSKIGKKSKVNHLAYIGDASLGESVNVGAGAITCNYDGFTKHKTVVGDSASIGANTAMVAPVKIGSGAIIAAGSVITKDVAKDALAVARADQSNFAGKAAQIRKKKLTRSSKK